MDIPPVRAHKDTDVVVGSEVCLESRLPPHVIFCCEHWQVRAARQSAGVVGHSGAAGGGYGGTQNPCRRNRRCREAHKLWEEKRIGQRGITHSNTFSLNIVTITRR